MPALMIWILVDFAKSLDHCLVRVCFFCGAKFLAKCLTVICLVYFLYFFTVYSSFFVLYTMFLFFICWVRTRVSPIFGDGANNFFLFNLRKKVT